MKELASLEHNLLIAMPSLENSWFEKTVIYVVEDNEQGSMGLVINLPHKFNIGELLEHFNIDVNEHHPRYFAPVLMGGPVDVERGFILHDDVGEWRSSMPLPDKLAMSVSEDLLEAMAREEGPKNTLVCLGFAGWSPGQLAQEMQENSWLNIPFNYSLVFETPIEQRWEVALGTLGISPEHLTMDVGHA